MTARTDARRRSRCGRSPLVALLAALGACLACAATAAAAPIHRCATSPGQTICLDLPALQLSGKATVSATVQSTADVWEVRFEWSGQPAEDGVHLFSDFEAPYTFTWPTAAFKDGSGTLSARVVKKDETTVGTPVAIPDPVVLANGNAVTPRNARDWQALERSRPYEGDPVVAAVGDSGAGTARTDAVAAAVGASNASLLLYLGDLYEDGTPPELRDNFGRSAFDEPGSADAWGRLMPWTRPTTGNHEAHRPEDFRRSWWHGRPDRYTFVHGGVRFIVLHSECNLIGGGGCGPGSVQYQFVQQTLADNDYACVVGIWHRPVLSAVEDNTTMRPIWKLLADGGGDVVLNGHTHNMEVYRPLDGDLVAGAPGSHMVELIGGAGGHALTATVETDPRAAWQRLKLSGAIYLTLVGGASGRATRIDWTFRDVNGQTMLGEGAFAGRSGAGSVSCGSAPAAPHATARPSIAGRAEEGRPLAALPAQLERDRHADARVSLAALRRRLRLQGDPGRDRGDLRPEAERRGAPPRRGRDGDRRVRPRELERVAAVAARPAPPPRAASPAR